MELKELIEEVLSLERTDKKKIIKILADGIEHKTDESELYKSIYKEAYNNELIPKLCEEWISRMSNGEESGSKWTIDEVYAVARRLDIDFEKKPYTAQEFRTVMTNEYYDHTVPIKKSGANLEPTGWGRIADYWLLNEPKEKLVDCFFWEMEHSK